MILDLSSSLVDIQFPSPFWPCAIPGSSLDPFAREVHYNVGDHGLHLATHSFATCALKLTT